MTRQTRWAIAAGVILFAAIVQVSDATHARRVDPIPGTRAPASSRCPQWWRAARSAGWSEHNLPQLDRIIWRESRCRPDIENLKDPWGGSVGLTQVNRGWVRWLKKAGVIKHSSDLFDGSKNLEAALAIYNYACARHGECWIAWGITQA